MSFTGSFAFSFNSLKLLVRIQRIRQVYNLQLNLSNESTIMTSTNHHHDRDSAAPRRSDTISECDSDDTVPERTPKIASPAQIYRSTSHMSGPDGFDPPDPVRRQGSDGKYQEADDALYDRLSRRRKATVVAVLSFCAFLSPQSSTSVLAATPEVAETFGTTSSIINVSNAAYMVFMGVSPVVWGPMSQVFGRSPVSSLEQKEPARGRCCWEANNSGDAGPAFDGCAVLLAQSCHCVGTKLGIVFCFPSAFCF